MKMKYRPHSTTKIDQCLDMDTNKVNTKSVSVWWCLDELNNTQAFEAQFFEKINISETYLRETLNMKTA